LGGSIGAAFLPAAAESFGDACVTGGAGGASRVTRSATGSTELPSDRGTPGIHGGTIHARQTRVSTVSATIASWRAIVRKLGPCAGVKTSSSSPGTLTRGASAGHERSASMPSSGDVSTVFTIAEDCSARYKSRACSTSFALISTIESSGSAGSAPDRGLPVGRFGSGAGLSLSSLMANHRMSSRASASAPSREPGRPW
jgi:hypothetical protein